jgi:hypothetical protein
MNILALDPASRLGFAYGESGDKPRTGTVRLKKTSEPLDKAFINFGAWLRDHFVRDRPELICIEHFLAPRFSLSQNSSILGCGLYANACMLAGLYGIRLEAPSPNEVRNYCCGRASAVAPRKRGSAPRTAKQVACDRTATKNMVLNRARLLNLIPADCLDDNRADAALIWFWASCVHARAAPKELFMFGEVA